MVSVADFLQTDDLFQLAKPRELPELPDFRQMPPPPDWACGHDTLAASFGAGVGVTGAVAEQPAAGLPPHVLAGGVPLVVAGSGTGPPPHHAGVGGASAPPGTVPQPPAPPWSADRAKRPPAPPGSPDDGLLAWLARWRATVMNPSAQMRSYLGEEEKQAGQGPLGPALPVKSDSGEEENHAG